MAKWSIPMRTIAERSKTRMARVIQTATYSVFNAIQLQWPVDTGLSRGNWQFGYNVPAAGPVDTKDPSGARAQAEARKALTTPIGGIVYYTNNTPYARRLEYEGWSAQAPNGAVRINALNFEAHVRAALKGLK